MDVHDGVSSVPTWVDAGDRQLAMQVHQAEDTVRGAVVLVGAQGREGTVAYRSARALAVLLAQRGYLVCRPDLSGTGDSAAVPMREDLASQWDEDLRAVAAWAHDLDPTLPVHAVGLRLGACLVARVADAFDGHKVAWVPVKPATWLRGETVARKIGVELPLVTEGGVVELLGTSLSAAQAASLKGLPRADAAPGWTTVEPNEDETPFWVGEPHFAEIPRRQLQAVADALPDGEAVMAPSWEPQSSCARVTESGRRVEESWVSVGPHGLPAVVVSPIDVEVRAVMVTTAGGAEAKYGPGGYWASLAVELADRGVASIRAERRGAGELSDPSERTEPNPYVAGADADVAAAVAWAQARYPSVPVTGAGLCIAGWMFAMASAMAPLDRAVIFNNAAWQPGLAFYARLDRKQALTAAINGNKVSPDGIGHGAEEKPWWATAKTAVKSVLVPLMRRTPLPMWRGLARVGLVQYPADLWRRASSQTEYHFHFGVEDAGYFRSSRGEQAVADLRNRGVRVEISQWEQLDHSLLALSSRRLAREVLLQAFQDGPGLAPSHAVPSP